MYDRQIRQRGVRQGIVPLLGALAILGGSIAPIALPRVSAMPHRTKVGKNGPDVSDRERQALQELASEIEGTVVYGRKGHIHKIVVGETTPTDLGVGSYARWSREGKQIAVWHDETILVMNADGSGRKTLAHHAAIDEDGCPFAFHPDGKEIVYCRHDAGLWAVNVATGISRKLKLPADYTGEPSFSADGKRLATRIGNDLYAVDLVANTHRKYARGCSPNVSPDGKRLLNNIGSHRQLVLRDWNGGNETRIDTHTMRPDREWDDHFWSNHPDYITTNGERSSEEAYVIRVSANRVTRVSWEGHAEFPDLFVARAKTAANASAGTGTSAFASATGRKASVR